MAFSFAPRWYWVLLTAAVLPLFIWLGSWQWHRGEYRRAQWDAFASTDVAPVEVNASGLAQMPRFTRVRVEGMFDGARQFLLDNISHAGAPGYEVLSVLVLADGSRLLVDRGWVPFTGYRDRLPDVALAEDGVQRLSGRLSVLPVTGIDAGKLAPPVDGPWPRVTSFPDFAQLSASYGAPLREVLLLLDAGSGPGYLREWQPPGLSPERHFAYAVQWWSFALLAFAMFIGFNLKRRHD